MRTVTHRELRNNSAEILRAVAAGETIQVSNNGLIAAIVSPPNRDPLDQLVDQGQVRLPTRPLADLDTLRRRRSSKPSGEIIDDVRGSW